MHLKAFKYWTCSWWIFQSTGDRHIRVERSRILSSVSRSKARNKDRPINDRIEVLNCRQIKAHERALLFCSPRNNGVACYRRHLGVDFLSHRGGEYFYVGVVIRFPSRIRFRRRMVYKIASDAPPCDKFAVLCIQRWARCRCRRIIRCLARM